MGAFSRGFRNRNPLVLVVAAVLLVPALLGFQWLFTSGAWTAVPLDVALRNREDSFTYISWMVGRAQQQPPSTPGLYLLGGSSARESIVERRRARRRDRAARRASRRRLRPRLDQPELRREPGRRGQRRRTRRPGCWSASTSAASRRPGRQNAEQAEGRELLLESGAVHSFVSSQWGLEKYQYTILPGIWSYITGWAREHGGEPARGRPAEHRVRAAPVLGGDAALRQPEEAARDEVEHEPQAGLRAEPGRQPADARGAAGAGPRARRARRAARAAAQQGDRRRQLRRARSGSTRSRSRRSASEYGVPYIDLNKTVDIPSRDFQDLSHLIAPGRVIWQHALAKELAPLLSADSGGSSG